MGKRHRRSRDEIREIVREFERSGLSDLEFAKRIGVQPQHLRHWVRRERLETSTKLVQVEVAEAGSRTGPDLDRFELVLGNGLRIFVSPHFDPAALLRLLEALGRC